MKWLQFLIGALVTYRLSLLFSKESGPWRVFAKIRNLPPPKSAAREGLRCLHCESIWWAVPVTWYFWWTGAIMTFETPLHWLDFSASAIILHHAFTEDFKKK